MTLKLKITSCCWLLCLGISVSLFAQNKQLRAFTLEDGLPQSQVYAMVQDHKGYLWLGTQGGGLARFDGRDFRVLNDSHGLPSNYIKALMAVKDTLYIGTNRGLSIKVRNTFLNTSLSEVLKICQIEKQLFLLTVEGLYVVKPDVSVEKVTLPPDINTGQINDLIHAGNHYWLATEVGLWSGKDLLNQGASAEKMERGNFTALVDYNHKIYASTFNDGTLVFEPDRFDTALLIKEPLRINSTSIQNDNQLWVATDNYGVVVIDTETNSELFSLDNTNGLAVPNVRQVLRDRQSNLWIATSGGGLYKYFQNNFKHFNVETGLNGNRVYAVHYGNNAVWISNSEKGLMRIDDYGVHDVDIPSDFSEVKIKTITSDALGNIWAGSDGRGLLFKGKVLKDSIINDSIKPSKNIPRQTVEVTRVLNTENGFPFDWIRALEIDGKSMYAATYSSGIVHFNYKAQDDQLQVFKIYGKEDGIQDLFIKHMTKDHKNRLWYGTQNGHLGYLEKGKITHLGAVLDMNVPINTVLMHNNTLFLGTAGNGIWWSDNDDFSTFKKLKGTKKITSENIYQLIFDNEGYLWVGTERGVDKLELDKDHNIKDAFFFGRNDGFLGIETCLNAVDKDKEGHLWFGALYGLTEYRPTESKQETVAPTIYLEDVKVAYKSIDSITLSQWSNSDKVLQLNPDQKQVSFSYKTIDLDRPDGIEYRFKLNEDDWSPWSTSATQDFSELNFGAHDFVVQSRNHRWKESDPLRFSFYIERPMYKKVWFQWLVFGLVGLVLSLLVFQYIKRLKRKNIQEKQRLELENHLLTLEQKALRLQMNPHFIFNVLNGIKAMAPNKPDKMNETVNSFATLLRETLVNSRKDTISLDQEIKTLRHYIEVERLMADQPFSYQIETHTALDPEEILIPPMLIQPFVENAIRHGILKGPRAGLLQIDFYTTDEFLKVTITDDGVGIFNSQEQKPKTDHQSMALKVTKERLESISGKGALDIKEIHLEDGTIGGTIITFKIPLETDY